MNVKMYIFGNMDFFSHSRYRILLAILFCYCLPLLAQIFFNTFQSPANTFWASTAIGLFITAFGSLILFMLITSWEIEQKTIETEIITIEPPSPEPTLDPKLLEEAEERFHLVFEELSSCKAQNSQLEEELDHCQRELLDLNMESERLHRELEQTQQEFEHFKASSEEKLEQNHLFLGEYQQTINEQRNAVETKQQIIEQLETKVRDLTYEIKTLLQIAEKVQSDKPQTIVPIPLGALVLCETNTSYQVNENERPARQNLEKPVLMSNSIAAQLKRCLDIAQKITGGSHYANRLTRTRDLSLDNNALDLRRLCDSLRSEASSPLWVYSQKESKLLFANQEIKNLLGWHPEKFIQNFSEIIGGHTQEWQNALAQLAYKNICQTQLSLKAKSGQTVTLQCHMGVISTGLFRGYIIGIADHEAV